MKNIIAAVLIVFGLGTIAVAALSCFEMTKESAKPLAIGLMTTIPAVHQLLEKRSSNLSLSASKRGVVNLAGYSKPWYFLALYGAMILIGVAEMGSGLCGFVAELARVPKADMMAIALLTIIPNLFFSYKIGFWIGARCQSKGIIAVLCAAYSAPIFDRTLLLILGNRRDIMALLHTESYVTMLVMPVLITGTLFNVFGLIGYWRGRKRRLERYLAYLMRALPEDCREMLADLAYGEATRLDSLRQRRD